MDIKLVAKTLIKVILTVAACSVMAGVYGIIHDQITITVSLDYFRYFKGLEYIPVTYRAGAAYIGWISTWWVGFFASLIMVVITLLKTRSEHFVRIILLRCVKIMCVAAGLGLIAGVFGYLFPLENNVWFGFLFPMQIKHFYDFALKNNVENYTAFFSVWMIHNFGYFGGGIGALWQIISILFFSKSKFIEEK